MRAQLLGVAKRKIAQSISELSPMAQFAVVYGDSRAGFGVGPTRAEKYPSSGQPVFATASAKMGAVRFIGTLPSEGFASIKDDLIEAVQAAARLSTPRKAVIYVGDGLISGDRNEMVRAVNEITVRNVSRVKIHTIGVSPYPFAEEFLKALAARNGGTYRKVE